MKKRINKHLKISLLIFGITAIIIISFLLYKVLKDPGLQEEKVSVYSYTQKGSINYKVNIKPSILYDEETIGEDKIIFTSLLDNIDTVFKYEFNGDGKGDISGDYEVICMVEGYTGSEENITTFWKKQFTLLEKKPFKSSSKHIVFEEIIPIYVEPYNDFANKVLDEIKVGAQSNMTVIWNINIKVKTDKGIVEEKLSPTMSIPLNRDYFEISGERIIEKPGNIEVTNKVMLPINKRLVLVYSVAIGLFFSFIMILVFFAEGVIITDPLERKLKTIFKSYGDRLVALNSELAGVGENYNEVKSIEDLVRIADELGRPIMYRYRKDSENISNFYLCDEKQIFKLDLIQEMEREESEKQNINNKVKKYKRENKIAKDIS